MNKLRTLNKRPARPRPKPGRIDASSASTLYWSFFSWYTGELSSTWMPSDPRPGR